MKLFVFDFDSTLIDGETLDILGDSFGVGKDIKAITSKAMSGEIGFFSSLVQRVRLLEGMSIDKVNATCENLPLTKGAKSTIRELKKMGHKVLVFSGGFTNATTVAKRKLGFDEAFANTLDVRSNVLSGFVGGGMMFEESKGIMLSKIQNLCSISKKDTAVVGDGANDISMFKHASLRFAFCAKYALKKYANIIIDKKDLSIILDEV